MDYVDNKQFDWQDIGAGGYSALNSALFGIPDVLVKAASSDAYEKLQKLRGENKAASLVGDVAGMFAPTGGLLAKGVGAGLKAGGAALKGGKIASGLLQAGKGLDTAADIIKTGKGVSGVGGAIARGGLAAAEQTIPRVLTGQQDLEQGLGNVALGGALGAGTYAAGQGLKRIPELMKEASKWGNKTMLQRAGVDSRVLRQQGKYLGVDPDKAEDFVKRTAEEVRDKQLYREPKLDAYRKVINDEWKHMAGYFDAADVKMSDLKSKILENPSAKDAVSRLNVKLRNGTTSETGEKLLQKYIDRVDNTSNFASKREYLNKVLLDDKTSIEGKEIAGAIKKALEETAEELSGMDINAMKKAYPIKAVLEKADFKNELSTTGAGIKRGSDTAAKLAISGLGAGVGGASAIPGIVDDPTNPDSWNKALIAIGSGVGVGLASKQIGNALAQVAMRLDPDDIAKMAQKVASAVGVDDVQKVINEFGVKASGIANAASIVPSKLAGANNGEQQAVEAEAVAEPEVAEQAKEEVNDKYTNYLKGVMKADWTRQFADQMSYEEFEEQVAELTDNFNPMKTANILFKDAKARDKYLKEYAIAMKVKETDINSITMPKALDNLTNPKSAAEQRKTYADFVDNVAALVSTDGSLPTDNEKKQVMADIKAIVDLDATPDEKKMLLMEKLSQKYGLSLDILQQLGVV